MKRTNIMLSEGQYRKLKSYAKKGRKTLGWLVREAVDAAYKKENSLERRKSIAIDAYKEGFISFGKLSEILGVDIVSAKLYLKEHKIPVKTQELSEIKQDTVNA